jgi:Acetyltransferase (GNAT) family.
MPDGVIKMEILEYQSLQDKNAAVNRLARCEWSAGRFLAELIKTRKLTEALGENPRILFLLDKNQIVSFATLTHQDAIRDEALYPWIGFVYTDKRYRGHRYSQKVIDHAISMARSEGHRKVYLATDKTGLYEKYGFIYMENRLDVWGEDSRIYCYEIER